MQERHTNRKLYFDEQDYTTKKYVIPFIEDTMKIDTNTSILEIGCGEGGNLKPFVDMGFKRVVGIDLSELKIENAKNFYEEHEYKDNIEFIAQDIYDITDFEKFDIIIMRDVIEHIHNQERFMKFVKNFLKPSSKFFLAFPPWMNPFGGHQQACKSRVLSKLPYFHILPKPLFKLLLKIAGEEQYMIDAMLEVKETGLTIERFERILKKNDYKIDKRIYYLINPNYEVKFKLKLREQFALIAAIPYFRDFFTTTSYYVISV
ncbi:MAG: SAM-dependent methyltransferase [Bacteroidetes bacterium 4572_112]|nr:MAG: SAM-dependent methyltransferase [Bacteroidetes bacterium 4572_112]